MAGEEDDGHGTMDGRGTGGPDMTDVGKSCRRGVTRCKWFTGDRYHMACIALPGFLHFCIYSIACSLAIGCSSTRKRAIALVD